MKNEFNFVEITDRLKKALKINADYELAEKLGMKATSFNSRKKAQSLPFQEILSLAGTEKLDYNWLLTGEGEMLSYDGIADSNTLSISKEEEKMITLYRRCSVEQKKDIVKDAEKYARHSDSIEQEIIKKIIAGKIDLKKLTK
jgi:hypothetical protein